MSIFRVFIFLGERWLNMDRLTGSLSWGGRIYRVCFPQIQFKNAILSSNVETTQLLLSQHSSLLRYKINKQWPLDLAATLEDVDIIMCLVDAGANSLTLSVEISDSLALSLVKRGFQISTLLIRRYVSSLNVEMIYQLTLQSWFDANALYRGRSFVELVMDHRYRCNENIYKSCHRKRKAHIILELLLGAGADSTTIIKKPWVSKYLPENADHFESTYYCNLQLLIEAKQFSQVPMIFKHNVAFFYKMAELGRSIHRRQNKNKL